MEEDAPLKIGDRVIAWKLPRVVRGQVTDCWLRGIVTAVYPTLGGGQIVDARMREAGAWNTEQIYRFMRGQVERDEPNDKVSDGADRKRGT